MPVICESRTVRISQVGCEIGVGPVIAIPYVVNGDFVAVDFCPSCLGDIGLPRAIVARLQRQPPTKRQARMQQK